jgi:hypothetical protein
MIIVSPIPHKSNRWMFRRKKALGKAHRKMGEYCLEGWYRFAPNTELE